VCVGGGGGGGWSFGAESFVFRFAVQKCTDENVLNYNFACCFTAVGL